MLELCFGIQIKKVFNVCHYKSKRKWMRVFADSILSRNVRRVTCFDLPEYICGIKTWWRTPRLSGVARTSFRSSPQRLLLLAKNRLWYFVCLEHVGNNLRWSSCPGQFEKGHYERLINGLRTAETIPRPKPFLFATRPKCTLQVNFFKKLANLFLLYFVGFYSTN